MCLFLWFVQLTVLQHVPNRLNSLFHVSQIQTHHILYKGKHLGCLHIPVHSGRIKISGSSFKQPHSLSASRSLKLNNKDSVIFIILHMHTVTVGWCSLSCFCAL